MRKTRRAKEKWGFFRKHFKSKIALSLFTIMFMQIPFAVADPILPVGKDYDAGIPLNNTLEYMARERLLRQIEEDRKKVAAKVEVPENVVDRPEGEVATIQLRSIATDPSEILTAEEIKVITDEYVGRSVSIQDLYAMVERLNQLYSEKGYVTCRAFLQQQSVENGTIKVTLVEGKTGDVSVQGNRWTREDYIKDRVHLNEGEIANVGQLNKDMIRFNATNDVQLRIVMKAGSKEGTTDYVIEAYEPTQYNTNVWMDNAGSYTSGEFRQGVIFTDKSVSGVRDNLMIGLVNSKGNKAFTFSYGYPISPSGTKLNFQYSNNSIDVVKGDYRDFDITGHSTAYSIGIIQPWVTTDRLRSEISFTFNNQKSETEMRNLWGTGLTYVTVDDEIRDFALAFSMTNYGRSHVIYQKHSLVTGNVDTLYNGSDRFTLFKSTAMYQKAYPKGSSLTVRGDFQWSPKDNLPSARQFYLGGAYSVRGYKESYKGADKGFGISTEYSFPLNEERTVNGFCFLDYGLLFGESAESAKKDRFLASVGFGAKAVINKNYFMSLTLGVPLKRNYNSVDKPHKARVNFMFNATF